MSNQPTARASQPADGHSGLRLLALAAVSVGVLLLAAAAFVLSYTGIHALALSAGVSPRLARLFPLIFDAMLVVACAAVLSLRGAGLPSRCYAWLSMLVLLAAAAAADALHATGTKLPHKPAAAAAAIIPWLLVLIGFGLLLSMLRHARLRRAAVAAAMEKRVPQASGHVQVRAGIDDLLGPKIPRDAPARSVTGTSWPPAEPTADLAIDLEPGHDDPVADEARLSGQAGMARIPRAREEPSDGFGGQYDGPYSAPPAPALSPAPTMDYAYDSYLEAELGPDADLGLDADPRPGTGPRPETEEHGPGGGTWLEAEQPGLERDTGLEAEHGIKGETQPEARPGPEAGPEAEPEPEARPEPEAETGPERGPEPDARPEAETGPEPEAKAGTGPETGPGPGPKTETVPSAQPQFDRMRSSPVPPGM